MFCSIQAGLSVASSDIFQLYEILEYLEEVMPCKDRGAGQNQIIMKRADAYTWMAVIQLYMETSLLATLHEPS